MNPLSIILLDNIDSFTFNLVDELSMVCGSIAVYRNTTDIDVVTRAIETASSQGPTVLVLSPGPGKPSSAGCMPDLIRRHLGSIPILGICLGHQALVEHYGGHITRAPKAMHGKSSYMHHSGLDVFDGITSPLKIARYHSLLATDLPDELENLAQIDGLNMAIQHKTDRAIGFQFHPESILTSEGSKLLKNTMNYLTSREQ